MSLLLIGVASTRSNVPVVRSLKSAMPEIRKTNKRQKTHKNREHFIEIITMFITI